MSSETPITVRRLKFSFPAGLDPMVIEGQPEESYLNIGLSLLLPHLEPYLIRTMATARKLVKDPKLIADIDAFNGQEGQHYRQHIRFNEAVRDQGFAALEPLEAELAADYKRFSETRSLRFNLAYAKGFEAMTMALARFSLECGVIDRLHPDVREMFEWHLLEELEHRTVAFDVYEEVCGGWPYRLAVGGFAQWHLQRFALRVSRSMCGRDPEAFRRQFGGPREAWVRQRPQLSLLARRFLPRLLATYSPWYSPHGVTLPPATHERTRYYSEKLAAQAAG